MIVLKNLWYMARRFKAATVLNLLGLTVAFAAFYLIMTQVDYSYSYNSCLAEDGRVFRLESKSNDAAKWGTYCNRPLHSYIRKMPQVEALSEVVCWASTIKISVGESTIEHELVGCSARPFEAVAPPRCLDGQLELDSLSHNALIPASLARKLFGRVDVAGQVICARQDTMTVRGVYEDFDDNCSMKNYIYYYDAWNQDNWGEWSYLGYVKLQQGVDVADFCRDLGPRLKKEIMQDMMGQALGDGRMTEDDRSLFEEQFNAFFDGQDFRLRPIEETYFSGVSDEDRGNPAMLFVLQLASVLIIIIAAINFLNFTLAESPMRIKSVNTRRVLGEGVGRLRLGLVAESVLTALVALGLALIVCVAVAQQHTGLLQGSLELREHTGLVVLLVVLALAVGVTAGLYPAFFATSFQPALALKGSFGLTPKGRQLRTALVGLQLGIALFMVGYVGILLLQSRYIYHSDYGFEKDEVLYAKLPDELMAKRDALRTELMQLPGVADVSYSRFILGSRDTYMVWGRGDEEHAISFTCIPVDCHYLRTMGIKVLEGRDFTEHDSDCYIINEAARKQWPWVEVDKKLLANDLPVIGVCENIRFASMRHDRMQEPLVFVIMGEAFSDWSDLQKVLNVRAAKNIDKTDLRRQIEQTMVKMADGNGEKVEVHFLDQELELLYQEELRFIGQVGWFCGVILIITLIGVFCLTMFETEYRRKEIGIRKVFGSSTAQVLGLLCRRYMWLLGISFVVAAPLAWYTGHEWLKSFAERTAISWWLFPVALLLVGLVTLGTVVIQSWRSANENPINSIKTE